MRVAVIGLGGVGLSVVRFLQATGDSVRVGHRHRPEHLPADVEYMPCDMMDAEAVAKTCRGMDAVVFCATPPYVSKLWNRDFEPAMRNIVAGCAAAGARFVFADNLYMYGPQREPLNESMALSDFGIKPRIRSRVTQIWLEAHRKGLIKGVAARASDYYGPRTTASAIGLLAIEPMLKKKRAMLIHAPDQPHAFTYIEDFGRALATLVHAEDADYGRAWHVPNAPAQTPRQILEMVARLADVPMKFSVLPMFAIKMIGLFDPIVASTYEMSFQRDRPYLVNDSDFRKRFWSDFTPMEEGLRALIASLR